MTCKTFHIVYCCSVVFLVGGCVWSLFCCAVLSVISSFAIILQEKSSRESWMIYFTCLLTHRVGGKPPTLSSNIDQESIETVFLIAICHLTVDKWQSKTLFLSIFDPRLSIVDYVFDCSLPSVFDVTGLLVFCFSFSHAMG